MISELVWERECFGPVDTSLEDEDEDEDEDQALEKRPRAR